MRRYDPSIPFYDLVVCEADGPPADGDAAGSDGRGSRRGWASGSTGAGGDPRTEFCHDVTAALFESLVARGEDAVEEAVTARYLDRAERVTDPDELCRRLLETTVAEIDDRLTAEAQRRLLDVAVARLPPTAESPAPIERTLSRLVSVALVDGYRVRRADDASDRESTVTVRDYALRGRERRVPTLPLAIDLRRRYRGTIAIPRATHRGGRDWQFELRLRAAPDRRTPGSSVRR